MRASLMIVVLACGLLLANTALAQGTCPASISGTVDASDPTQTGRLLRNAVASTCAAPKTNPGTFTTTGARNYDLYRVRNTGASSSCVRVAMQTPGGNLFMVAYSTFNPSSVAANYLADPGSSTANTAMELSLAAAAEFDLVVSGLNVSTTDSYTISLEGCRPKELPQLTVSAVPPASFIGQSVAVSATVTPASDAGTPTGTVVFYGGASVLTPVLVDGGLAASTNVSFDGGVATASFVFGSVGTQTLTASYSGDFNFLPANSPAVSHVVNPGDTTTTLVPSSNPTPFGAPLTLTANVSVAPPARGVPTGLITFFDGPTAIGNGTVDGGTAQFITSSLGAGAHSLTASYAGSTNFVSSTSPTTPLTVTAGGTTVALGSSGSPTVYGSPVTFTATVSATGTSAIPQGTVSFLNAATPIGSVVLDGGVGVFVTSALPAGSNAINVSYGGSTNHTSATANLTQVVNRVPTSTTVSSTPTSSVFGQTVLVSAAVTSSGGVPDGGVTFTANGAPLGSAPLVNGVATLSTALAPGQQSLVASYAATQNFSASTSPDAGHLVNPAPTSVVLTSSSNPIAPTSAVTLIARASAVAPGGGVPAGDITFFDGVTQLGVQALADGGAQLTTTLDAGVRSLTASYGGSASHASSTSPVWLQVVDVGAVATLQLQALTSPSVYGQSFTLRATASSASGTPTGSVTFFDGATQLGTGTLSSGVAQLATSALSGGAHLLRAVYAGGSHPSGASAVVSHVVTPAASTTALQVPSGPLVRGQSVTLTADVSSSASGSPLGVVRFIDGSTELGAAVVANGTASFIWSSPDVGAHSVTATYAGDSNFATSASTQSITINQGTTTTTLSSSANPSRPNAPVVLFAAVAPVSPATGMPTGAVNFMSGSTMVGTSTLSPPGVASLTLTPSADVAITATYVGDSSFAGSTSPAVSQQVSRGGASVAVAGVPNPARFGTPVTVVTTVAGTDGVPTGMVSVSEGTTVLGTSALGSTGLASLSVSSLRAGMHVLTARYSGDTTYDGGVATVTQVISQAPTTTALTVSPNPALVGQSVTLSASVTAGASGQVEFFEGTTSLGTAMLASGSATVTTTFSSAGVRALSARYAGDDSFEASTSATSALVVGSLDAADAGTGGTTTEKSGCGCHGVINPMLGFLALAVWRRRRSRASHVTSAQGSA